MTPRPRGTARTAAEFVAFVGRVIAEAGELVLRTGHAVTRLGYRIADHERNTDVRTRDYERVPR